jgi:hypothetical protein
MKQAPRLAWLLKAALSSLTAVLFCAIITPIIADPQIETSDKDGEAAPTLIDYQSKPVPSMVLLGTSLAYRLQEELFLPLKVRNLAIPGRSCLNGLEIIASYPTVPASIFIETNVMVWNVEDEFVKKFSYSPRPHFQIVPPIRSVVSHLSSPRKAERPQVDDSILNDPPTDYDNKVYVDRGKQEWSVHAHDSTISSNVDALVSLVKKVEARGSKVYFFEMPLAAGMADTTVATRTRSTFHDRFREPWRWLQLNYPVDQLRFRDHAHLDERSALIVARAMRDSILILRGRQES